ncbi:FMN-binding protein [Ligilactobacillus salivarius]|nr:FMN-binding protein [Ligilactobacillus salivarius]MDW3023339.1 FMN-binding protein [Ligilactobacillus salivarius]
MISKNTYEVGSISGASATSRALKEAVKDAMNKI